MKKKYIRPFQPIVPHDKCNDFNNECCFNCRLWFAGYRVHMDKLLFIKYLVFEKV